MFIKFLVGEVPADLKKYVVVAGPHTSNWDFFYGRLYFFIQKIPVKFFIKKEWFFFPMGLLFNKLGGIPVDRKKKSNLTDQIVEKINENERFVMMVTPEGTRKYNPEWKKGFYYIAVKAKIPIVIGFLDYPDKQAGVTGIFYPTGNYEKDILEIKAYYKSKRGRFPENGIR